MIAAAAAPSTSLRLRHNVLASFASTALVGGLAVTTTPLYLRAPGAEQWGLVATCMTVQGLLGLADVGMGMLSLEDLGRYVAIAGLGLALLQPHAPLGRALLPRLSALHATNRAALSATMRRYVGAVAVCCVQPAAMAVAAAEPPLRLWLGDVATAAEGVLPPRLILAATMLNAACSVLYLLIVASRDDRVIVAINRGSIAASFATVAAAGPPWTATTGGAIRLAVSTAQCLGGAPWLSRRGRRA